MSVEPELLGHRTGRPVAEERDAQRDAECDARRGARRGAKANGGAAAVLVPILLLAAAMTFPLGVTLPLVHFERLYFLSDTPSLIELLLRLWEEDAVWLAAAVFLFSFVFPLLKLFVTFRAAFAPNAALPRWTGALAKWSMMDVVLVALVIMAAKTSGLADAAAQPGIWFYGASAALGAVAAGLIARRG